MRNLQIFNKALLAKQAWRVMTNTNSLMAKALKNKYFPNTSFMEVKVSSVASYTWRSILSARPVISEGAIKIVGTGHSINVWLDPWILRLPHYKLLPRNGSTEELPQTVAELIDTTRWNSQLLAELVSSCCHYMLKMIRGLGLSQKTDPFLFEAPTMHK